LGEKPGFSFLSLLALLFISIELIRVLSSQAKAEGKNFLAFLAARAGNAAKMPPTAPAGKK